MLSERVYREKVNAVLSDVEKLFCAIDPDVAECTLSQGTLRIEYAAGTCILSQQPSIQELWVAVSAKAAGYHFYLDNDQWIEKRTHKEFSIFWQEMMKDIIT